jgi:hypothetical protein
MPPPILHFGIPFSEEKKKNQKTLMARAERAYRDGNTPTISRAGVEFRFRIPLAALSGQY